MYSVWISIPFLRTSAGNVVVSGEWARALRLLRDSHGGRYGPIVVAAPEATVVDELELRQEPETICPRDEDISFESLGLSRWRLRQFWANVRHIRRRCREVASRATVVHTGINDAWMPYSVLGFLEGVRSRAMTVFVLDTDIAYQVAQLNRGAGVGRQFKARAYSLIYQRVAKRCIAEADLCLLKGSLLHQRYGHLARRAEDFHNTSFRAEDVVTPHVLQDKCREVAGGGPLRVLSIGRLVPRKGVDHSVRAVAAAVTAGGNLTMDVIGTGPQEDDLKRLAGGLPGGEAVRFLGSRRYGPELLRDLATYHVFIFTALGEDTPRALFDAMAAGLCLASYDLPYARQVHELADQRPPVAMDVAAMTQELLALDKQRERVVQGMRASAAAAPEHTVEKWYSRRARWTAEVYEQWSAGRSARRPADV